MTTSKTWRRLCLLLPLLALLACDDNPVIVDPPSSCTRNCDPEPPGGGGGATPLSLRFQGEKVAVFSPGRRRTVDYYVWHADGDTIEVDVVELPKRASYIIANVEGDLTESVDSGKHDLTIPKKKISITWTPDPASKGLYPLTLWGKAMSNKREQRFIHLELLVENEAADP